MQVQEASPNSAKLHRRQVPGMFVAKLTLLLGCALSLLLALYIAQWERRALHDEVREHSQERSELLRSTLRHSMQVLHSLAALHRATGVIHQAHFSVFSKDALARQPELQAVEWIPLVSHALRGHYERAKQQDGYDEFTFTEIDRTGNLVAAAERAVYFPVYFVEPFSDNEAAHGFDLGADPRRREALDRARATGMPAATAPLRLAQEAGGQQGFLMALPVFRAAASDGIEAGEVFGGFALVVFRSGDLVRNAFLGIADKGVSVAMYDVDAGPTQPFFSQPGHNPDHNQAVSWWADWLVGDLTLDTTLEVAGRPWRVVFSPNAHYIAQRLPWQSFAFFMAGVLITILLASHLRVAAQRAFDVQSANAALQVEITERQRAVEAAESANRAKSDFLAHMSHEIRTPMNALLGYAQILRCDLRLDGKQREAVNAIIVGGNHLLGQINDVLDVAKIETGRVEIVSTDFDINEVLREIDLMFRPRCLEKRLNLRIDALTSGQSEVHADVGKLRQILINLVGNAMRFTQIGEVFVGVKREADDRFRFDIIDTGSGIAESELDDIFKPFYQGKSRPSSGGTGLGLAIAQRLAALMGGRLSVVSELGVGSRFMLRLPLPDAVAPAIRSASGYVHWQLAPGKRLCVAVVDDVAANRHVLARMLSDSGCEVLEAETGEAALQCMADNAVNVVFLDVLLPDRDGLEIARLLRENDNSLRIIAYTALVFEPHRASCIAAGCDDFISKPFLIDDLFSRLDKLCHSVFVRTLVDDGGGEKPLPLLDHPRLRVPAELLSRMLTATELHSSTVIKACLEELGQLGHDERMLAQHLSRHLRTYDMDAIARLLVRIPEAAT